MGKNQSIVNIQSFLRPGPRIFIITSPLKLNEGGIATCGRDPFSSEETQLVTRPLRSPLMYATVLYGTRKLVRRLAALFLVLEQKKLCTKQHETEHFM